MKNWMIEYAYLITIVAVLAVIAGAGMYTEYLRDSAPNVQAAADAPEIEQSSEATVQPTVSPLPTIEPLEVRTLALRTGGSTVMPVSGGVIRAYAPQEPVLWEALSCVQVHHGVDIAGEAGENVRCAMDGTVRAVIRDELWGWRVRVMQTNGAEATYAGLALCVVTAGENVTRGQTLGTLIDAVPCEAELGPHLHLEVVRNGEQENPWIMLEQAQAYVN